MDGPRILSSALLSVFVFTPAFSQATLNVTSGSLTVFRQFENDGGVWAFAADDLTASGNFFVFEYPGQYLVGPFESPVDMSWVSDSEDGFDGSMTLKGVTYNLTSGAGAESVMNMTAAPIVLTGAGTYREPFTFSAGLCGFLSGNVSLDSCDTTVDVVGRGTLAMVVVADPQGAASFDIESITWKFANAPEPATLALFATGLVALGLRRRARGTAPR